LIKIDRSDYADENGINCAIEIGIEIDQSALLSENGINRAIENGINGAVEIKIDRSDDRH
jgi:hypothetical protein